MDKEKFVIEYTLEPENVTLTQVNWQYDQSVVRSKVNTYSKSPQETITFDAVDTGTTEIVFTTRTSKTAVVSVEVWAPIGELPVFETPSTISYDIASGEIRWAEVGKFENGVSVEKDVGGFVNGLSCYELSINTYDDNNQVIDNQVVQPFNRFYAMPNRGVKYGVSIRAVGDNKKAKTSKYSEEFRFVQIAAVSDLANNNHQGVQ